MNLPVPVRPTFDVSLASRPSKKVKCQTMTVAEKKLLLIAVETGSSLDLLKTVDQVVGNCLVEKNLPHLSVTDKVLIFLEIRKRSMGDNLPVSVKCSHCDEYSDVNVNLSNIKVSQSTIPAAGSKDTFKVGLIGDIGILVRDPDISDLIDLKLEEMPNEAEALTGIITQCIVGVYDSDSIFWVEDLEPGEIDNWFKQLPIEAWDIIEDHFTGRPVINLEQKWVCEKCKAENNLELSGLSHFFV